MSEHNTHGQGPNDPHPGTRTRPVSPEAAPPQRDDELCANCGYTYAGHISNTGVPYPDWKPSGRYAEAAPPRATTPEPLTPDQLEALAEFQRAMRDETIPAIVETLAMREEAAQATAPKPMTEKDLAEIRALLDLPELNSDARPAIMALLAEVDRLRSLPPRERRPVTETPDNG